MLSVHFKFPDPQQWKAASQPLEVVLVNAKTREKPANADILAQANLDRGGTLNYPAEARGKMYGNLRLTVTIRPDGNVESIELDRSSGLKVLDAAAFKIVRMATPFAAFPPDIRRDTDLLVITRTWFFGQGDKIWTE